MIGRLVYKIFYLPPINFILRNIVRLLNDLFNLKIQFSVSGIVKLTPIKGKSFKLCLNESSAAHIYFWDRPENFEYTILFSKLIEKVGNFIDIGSNIGYYTALANAVNPNIRVDAFEPANGPYIYLNKNFKLNNWKNTKINKIALSEARGVVTFYEGYRKKYPYLKYHLSGIGSTQNTHSLQEMKSYEVKTDTLDNYIAENKIENVDIIKIDTEATEHIVLRGGKDIISKFKPIIICEVLSGFIEKEIKTFTHECNYSIFECRKNYLIERSSFTDPSIIERNFFLVPQNKIHLIEMYIKIEK